MKVLVLQHPQEKRIEITTVPLLAEHLPNVTVRNGLSWRNLSQAVGETAVPKEWVVLYLGSAHSVSTPDQTSAVAQLVFVDRKGRALEQPPRTDTLKGLVVLDGTWSQAKALWWRNAWLLKLHRAVLIPPRRSLYDRIRREPRREALSTFEAVTYALASFPDAVPIDPLLQHLAAFIDKHK